METKQTAVQILVESMTTSDVSFYQKEIAIALQMEREQIIKSNRAGVDMVYYKVFYLTGEQYYEQTYGGKDELPLYTVVVDDDSKVLSISLDIDEQTFGGQDE